MIDVRKVEYFLKVAELLNFSAAARELNISHQTLSKQIKTLEQEIGVDLLERSTTKVSLTEVGRRMTEIFAPVINHIDQGERQLEEFIQNKSHNLRIAYFSGLSYKRAIAPLIEYIFENYPEIKIDLTAVDIAGLINLPEMLKRDEVDLVICIDPVKEKWSFAERHVIFKGEQKILVSNKHPWYKKNEVTIRDISLEDFLVFYNSDYANVPAFSPNLIARKRIPVSNYETYMAYIEQGRAFGLAHSMFSRREGDYKTFEIPKDYDVENAVIIAYKKLHPRSKMFKELLNIKLSDEI